MPSKKQRAKAKANAKAKMDANSINIGALSIKDDKNLSISELKIQNAKRINKLVIDVVDNFSSGGNNICCRHGATNPISHRCQRLVTGVADIFKEEVIQPDLDLLDANKTFHESVNEKELSLVSACDFGYEEQRWNISYLSALGTELILHGHGEIALLCIGSYLSSAESNLHNTTSWGEFGINLANSAGKVSQESITFFAKRSSCDCLKKKFNLKDAKKDATKAKCCNCNNEMPRKKLSLCSRCTAVQYCCKGCQVDHWREHKPQCDEFSKQIKSAKKNSKANKAVTQDIRYEFKDGKVTTVSYSSIQDVDSRKGGQNDVRAVLDSGEEITLSGVDGDTFAKVMSNPKFQALIDKVRENPKVMQALQELDNPTAMNNYMNDPEVGPVLREFHEMT